ncbi:orotidine 5'-phosphate decarboxylase [compost metagenome]
MRALAPSLPLLIPGVGAQGGDAVATVKAARIGGGPIIINSSRAVLYASQGDDFAQAARLAAQQTRDMLNAVD